MRKTIDSMDWEALLPEPLKGDKQIYAAAVAIAEQKRKIAAEIWRTRIWTELDRMPEPVLDALAYDLEIDWYDYDYPLKTKREIIKKSWFVYRHLGTVGAVRAAIQAVYPNANVEEWWQDFYNGEPYHFRILLEMNTAISPRKNDELMRVVSTYKPIRSRLDGMPCRATENIHVRSEIGGMGYWVRRCGTYPPIVNNT